MLNQKTVETLVLSLMILHLDYTNVILAGLPETTTKKLQRIQNMVAKLVLDDKKSANNFDSLRTLHWLPVRLQINFKILCIICECLKGQALEYLKNILCHVDPKYNHKGNNNDRLIIPFVRKSTFAARSFHVYGPRI